MRAARKARNLLRRYGVVIWSAIVASIMLQQYMIVFWVSQHLQVRQLSGGVSEILNASVPIIAGRRSELKPPTPLPKETSSSIISDRFLIFRHVFTGQGAGNVISGLLSAHFLGNEFARTVCVDYPSFQKAFVFRDENREIICKDVLARYQPSPENTIKRNSYDQSGFSSECSLRDRLNSSDPVIYFIGNTYPRWPTDRSNQISDDLLHFFYQPSQKLLQTLPWSKAPHTVVHLRQGDGELDNRAGLEKTTLNALGERLPRDTFLVTNRVEWYDFFEEQYGWAHPPWRNVTHSALHLTWGERKSSISPGSITAEADPVLELWADWYTVVSAKIMYHTPSDFSRSAARWNSAMQSWSIRGTSDNGQLDYENDAEGEGSSNDVLPLSRRTSEQLKNCFDQGISQDYKDSKLALVLALAKRRRERFDYVI